MKHKFFVFRDKSNGKLLGIDKEANNGCYVGAFEPGFDGNYYDHLFFMSENAPTTPKEFLDSMRQHAHRALDFPFMWEDIEIVEVEVK